MFNTAKVAGVIRSARIAKNLTQADVADAMGVSFQAVSNWERGNSMPDIGKLGELARLLGVSMEELLGEAEAGTVRKVLRAEERSEPPQVTYKELAEVSPILPPETTERLVDAASKVQDMHLEDLAALAPHLASATVDRLGAAENVRVESVQDLEEIAPFMSREVLDKMAEGVHVESVQDLEEIAFFVSREVLDKIAEGVHVESPQDLEEIAPFVSREVLDKIAEGVRVESVRDLECIAPFVSREVLDRIALTLLERK